MNNRTAANVDASGLSDTQIKWVLQKVGYGVRYNRREGRFKCLNFDVADKVRDLRNACIRKNMRRFETENA